MCEDDDPLSLELHAQRRARSVPPLPVGGGPEREGVPRSHADGRKPNLGKLGGWYWESGFDKHPITDMEQVRDQNLRAMYGAWDTLKNVDGQYPNHRLKWAAFIAGKRESRR